MRFSKRVSCGRDFGLLLTASIAFPQGGTSPRYEAEETLVVFRTRMPGDLVLRAHRRKRLQHLLKLALRIRLSFVLHDLRNQGARGVQNNPAGGDVVAVQIDGADERL